MLRQRRNLGGAPPRNAPRAIVKGLAMASDSPALPPEATDPVGALLVQCMEDLAQGNHGAIEELCRAHPEHVAEIRERMGILLQMGLVEGVATDSDEFPERLGEFQLVRRLGGGGMGVVYEALQERLGRTVALKLIRPEHLYFPRARERFRRETEAVAKLQHPAIVSIYTVGEERGIPYFAMELVRGATLADILTMVETRASESLRGEDLRAAVLGGSGFEVVEDNEATRRLFDASWADACTRIVFRIADALAHAHSRGVLHRDIKPSNIAITPAGRVVLLDFGLATASVDVRMTTYGTAVGSVLYMAPEQIEGRIDEIDARTDVYALGITLYELLTLQVPYSGRTSDEVRAAIRDGKAPPIRVRNHRVSRDLETVCMQAIEGERGRRYAGMQEFAADLKRVLEREPIAARPPGATARTLRWVARNPASTMASLLAAMLLVGVPTLLYVQQLRYGGELERSLQAEMLARDAATQAREAADREREHARLEARDSETVASFLADIFASADPEREQGRAPTAAELLRRGVARIETELADQPELRARLQERMAESFRALGLYDDALPLAERALAVRRRLHEPDDVRTASILTLLGSIRRLAGLTDQGVAELVEAREIYSCALGASHRDTLLVQLRIANAYSNYNAHDVALGLIHDAWAALEIERPDDVQLRMAVLDSLAFLGKMQRNAPEHGWAALEFARVRAASGDWNVERDRTVELVLSAMPLSDWRSRRALQEESTELARRTWGEGSPRYAEKLAVLGSLRGAMGELDEALANLDEAGAILITSLGAEHPMSLYCARMAADVELRMGRGTQACTRLENSAADVRARLGDDHPRPLLVWLTSAQIAAHTGHLSERTERLAELALESRFSPADRAAIRLRALSLLGLEHLERGDVAGARRELERIGPELFEPGADFGLFVAIELALDESQHQRALDLMGQALARPDSRMYEIWRGVLLAFQREIATQSLAPTSDARARVERCAAQLRVAFGTESAVYRRLLRHATALLEHIDSSAPTPAR